MKSRVIFEFTTAVLVGGVLALLAACASPGSATAWQKVQVQDEAGQPIVGATAKMTAAVDGNEQTTTIGLSDEMGSLVLPKSDGSTYYFLKDGYNPMVVAAAALFGPAPTTVKRYSTKGDVLIIILTKDKSVHPDLFDADKMWQNGVVDPIKNMPVIPINPKPN